METKPTEIKIYETFIIFKINKKTNSFDKKTHEDIKKLLQSYSYKYLVENYEIGIKPLAYEVKQQSTGYYIRYIWGGTQEYVKILASVLKNNDEICDFLTTVANEKHLAPIVNALDLINNN